MKDELRRQVQQISDERGLRSCMSGEKWAQLRNAMMSEMPFQPPYLVKFITDDLPAGDENELVSSYHPMPWHEAYVFDNIFDASFALEWVKICPRYYKHRGKLIAPEEISAEAELLQILEKYAVAFEKEDGVYTIYGWR